MNRTILPIPPDPSGYKNPGDWMRDAHRWMAAVKSRIEADSVVNITPVAPFVVSTYTAVSTVTGTDSLSNFVATLVSSMQDKGLTAPASQRTTS